MNPKYGHNLQLCYMDTDSLMYDIKTEAIYKDIAGDVHARFDTSNYSKKDNCPFPIGVNKKVIGMMKDKLVGKIMTEFIGLRPKLYAYKTYNGGGDKKCKGVKKCLVKKNLSFEDYKHCLFYSSTTYRRQLMFQNRLHEVHTVEVNKVALSSDDD